MKKKILIGLLSGLCIAPLAAHAADEIAMNGGSSTTQNMAKSMHDSAFKPWLVRLRAVQLNMKNEADPIPALGVTNKDTVHVSDKTIPEVDISYFFTPNWAAELVLTVPQKHDVTLENGGTSTKLGTFKHLPPTLSMQYHFTPNQKFQPYVSLGVNYTKISSVNVSAGGGPLTLDKSSVGLSYGVGFDYDIGNNMVLNFDLKKIDLGTDVYSNGTKVTHLNLDPLLVGVGIGWKF